MLLIELQQFGKKILIWLYVFIAAFIFFFAFGFNTADLTLIQNAGQTLKITLPYPVPSYDSISTLFFKKIQSDLLIKQMELITINPLDALWAQIGISLFLAFVITLPVLLYKLISFFSSALKKNEKRIILKTLLPSTILFFAGCVFAYYFLIPLTFKFLYSYVLAMGVKPFFVINQFVSLVLIMILGIGLIFLLPIFMILLTKLGVVKSDVWEKNWQYAILIFLIIAAIITPDGTGITMVLLTLPLIMLYLIGCVGSKKYHKKFLNPNLQFYK